MKRRMKERKENGKYIFSAKMLKNTESVERKSEQLVKVTGYACGCWAHFRLFCTE